MEHISEQNLNKNPNRNHRRNRNRNINTNKNVNIGDRLKKWVDEPIDVEVPSTQDQKEIVKFTQNDHDKQQQLKPSYTCICERDSELLRCEICHMLYFGRVAEICLQHRNMVYLMDYTYCLFCYGPKESLKLFNTKGKFLPARPDHKK